MTKRAHIPTLGRLWFAPMLSIILCIGCAKNIGIDPPPVDSGSTPQDSGLNTPDLPDPADTNAPLNDIPEPTTPDAVAEDTGPDCGEAGNFCFEQTCIEHSDCGSGFCTLSEGEKVCSKPCSTEDCPAGWSCESDPGGLGSEEKLCLSNHPTLCLPCNQDVQCDYISEDAQCIAFSTQGSFCATACDEAQSCPAGYVCESITLQANDVASLCIPIDGTCACSQFSIENAHTTECTKSNEIGSCSSPRICTEEGLSSCTAQTPALESCNGYDDDCDGQIDENTCDDQNACTDDYCDANSLKCVHEPVEIASCDDGNECTRDDVCNAGACIGSPLVCDDEEICTSDTCDPQIGCIFLPNSLICNDGNDCTFGDRCTESLCGPGESIVCDDGNPCTTDACDEDQGCTFSPNVDLCDDGNACTLNDQCSLGSCAGGDPLACDDNEVCTTDLCVPDEGCTYTENSMTCTDGSACTLSDICQNGVCVGIFEVDCDDGNSCTDDSCYAALGCVNVAGNAQCNDSNTCTTNDTCINGACKGVDQLGCDDLNPCTTDSCDPIAGCVHTQNSEPCTDGNSCTTGDHCVSGSCSATSITLCDDGNLCTQDSCDPGSGCININNSLLCNDNNSCTINDQCSDGTCSGDGSLACDDGNECTLDGCLPEGGCTHEPRIGSCSDGDPCTVNDTCSDAVCQTGPERDCDDGNECTADLCAASGLCTHSGIIGFCDDGNSCTQGDQCNDGVCTSLALLSCDDDNTCTTDSCHPVDGCLSENNSLPCSDGSICTSHDTCAEGICSSDIGLNCDDNNPCTNDSCDAVAGCIHTPIASGCDDGNACTTVDLCFDGSCMAADVLQCDDNNPCTTDGCHPGSGCVYFENDAPCTDGDVCTVGDSCDSGSCYPGTTPLMCNDNNPCTNDVCNSALGCSFIPNEGSCNDADACTEGDYCSAGFCQASTLSICNDNNSCTSDSCHPNTGCVFTPLSPCCGNGAQESGEQCDDGNQQIGDGCSSNCQIESFEVSFLGYASWTQNVCGMSDVAQDAVMDSTCSGAFGASARSATTDELISGLVLGLPANNTSGKWVLLKCPNCVGGIIDGFDCASSGHCRSCVANGAPWPTNTSSGWDDFCCTGIRQALCVE